MSNLCAILYFEKCFIKVSSFVEQKLQIDKDQQVVELQNEVQAQRDEVDKINEQITTHQQKNEVKRAY